MGDAHGCNVCIASAACLGPVRFLLAWAWSEGRIAQEFQHEHAVLVRLHSVGRPSPVLSSSSCGSMLAHHMVPSEPRIQALAPGFPCCAADPHAPDLAFIPSRLQAATPDKQQALLRAMGAAASHTALTLVMALAWAAPDAMAANELGKQVFNNNCGEAAKGFQGSCMPGSRAVLRSTVHIGCGRHNSTPHARMQNAYPHLQVPHSTAVESYQCHICICMCMDLPWA